jgi:hypothetical protein
MGFKDFIQLEEDIQQIAVLSRKVPEEHALIRLILSALATTEELENLVKKDIRKFEREGINYYSVRLTAAGKTRIAPIDPTTYNVLVEITRDKSGRQRIFSYSPTDMDNIIRKYSPRYRKYDAKSLRDAVSKILRDCMFFDDEDYVRDLLEGENFEKVTDFLYDFHPLFSGMWDLDDDDVAEDFIATFSRRTGISDPEEIARIIGEDVERVKGLMRLTDLTWK